MRQVTAGAQDPAARFRGSGTCTFPEVVESHSSSGRIARDVATGARWGLTCAVALWIGDLVSLVPNGGAKATQWLAAGGSAFFVAGTTGAVLGGLLGPLLALLAADRITRTKTALERLHSGDLEARRSLAAAAIAAALLGSVWTWAAYDFVFAEQLELARPESIAAVLALSHLVFAVTLVAAWRPAVAFGRFVFDRASGWPGVRRITRRPWGVPVGLAVAGLLAAAGPVVANRAVIADLPWHDVVPLPAAVVFAVLAHRWMDPASDERARVRRSLGAATVAALVVSGIVALQLRPESTTVRKLAFERMLSGRLGYAAWTAAFDFDRDGQLSVLGGGDCAPFDASRRSGAVDVPGNGIDEDCDGADQPVIPIRPRGRIPMPRPPLPARPSIVLVTIDALAAPRLRSLGAPVSVMPHLDALAQGSKIFTRCFSQGPSTRLSFPSIFTSRWDSQLAQVYGLRHPYSLAPSERQLQDALDEDGYETVAILPSAYFGPSRWPSLTRGFQHVDTSAVGSQKFNAARVTDAALRALSAPGEQPLYLWVHYYDAHGPYVAPPDYGDGPRSDEAFYAAALTFVDRQLERLFAAIDARNDPVYLIVAADHATVFHPDPSTRRGHYGNDLYTATLHVPLIVRGPGIAPGHVDDLVSTMDIAPTISDLLNIKDRSEQEGTSLLPELFSNRRDPERPLFHELFLYERELHGTDPLELVSVRQGRFNLVLDRVHGTYELYDWTSDYFEQRDLYEDEARSPEALRLRALLGSFMEEFNHRGPGRIPSTTGPAGVAGGAAGDRAAGNGNGNGTDER